MGSEMTAAAAGIIGKVRRDPMAMLPFCGYNMGAYFGHWLEMRRYITNLPRFFHVNWFRKSDDGKFLWPGYGDNMRVLEWIVKRCHGNAAGYETQIGWTPAFEDFNIEGLEGFTREDYDKVMAFNRAEWKAELVSQGDNFFVMHLLAERDLSILGEANAHFSPEILHLLRTEPVKGNCYFWSAPDQPYVVGMRVDPFEALAPAAPVVEAAPAPAEPYEARLLRSLVATLVTSARVYLYRVEAIDEVGVEGCVAVAGAYLAQNIPEAAAFRAERPDDWELRWERVVLRVNVLDALLGRAGLAWRPLRAEGAVENKGKRAMVLLKEARLAELAARLGRSLRAARVAVRLFSGQPRPTD
jgi:hypothetical protein